MDVVQPANQREAIVLLLMQFSEEYCQHLVKTETILTANVRPRKV